MTTDNYAKDVFINCPFDIRYKKLFRAIVFTVIDCGFNPRCALEVDDSSEERLKKISNIIKQCKFGIHDLSRTQLDSENKLPRFNMPLELGLFLGAKEYGAGIQKQKICLIMDKERFRYQKFISDIAGKDIKGHSEKIENVIGATRNWLSNHSNELIPGKKVMSKKYAEFLKQLPKQANSLGIESNELTFGNLVQLTLAWIERYDEINS